MERWPNFFIVGAPRSGTTSLYEYLSQIPRIYMSPVKEPEYFSPNRSKTDGIVPIIDKKKYLDLFQKVEDELIIGEASTCYLEDPASPRLIHETAPNTHIIVMIRDPIERAYSHYLIQIRNKFEKQSFHDTLKPILKNYDPITSNHYLHAGLYSEPILRYINTFGEKNIKIIIFEEFIQNERKTVQDVLSFLDIDHKIKDFQNTPHNVLDLPKGKISKKILHSQKIRNIAGKMIPTNSRQILKKKLLIKKEKPKMLEQDKKILRDFYKEDVKHLKNILGRDLPWVNF